MKFEIIILSGVIIVLLIIFFLKKSPTKYTNVKIGNTEIRAEIADNIIKRTKGLMFRKSLPENEGMLFVFNEEEYHSFWMMNMSFPIDIIWINQEKKVIDIVENAQPCKLSCSTYKPKEKAMYVLEVNANFTEKHGIEIESSLDFKLSHY
jgi:uncharacterized membrane protein (UPF0127 family)